MACGSGDGRPDDHSVSITPLELTQYVRTDPYAHFKPGRNLPATYVVQEAEIVVRAKASGISRVDVSLGIGQDIFDTASGVPDDKGNVEVRLTLPDRGVPYGIQGTAVRDDQSQRLPGDLFNSRDERVIAVRGFTVMASDE
jgi:hypothetical protein